MTQLKLKLVATTAIATIMASGLISDGAQAQDAQELQRQVNELRRQLNELSAKLEETTKKAEEKSASDIKVKWEPAPSISSADGKFEMNLRGRVLTDTAWVNDSDNNENTKATELRAARIGIEGKAWSDVKYKFEADFADNEVDVKDAYIQWSGPVKFTVGQFKTFNSLEEQNSSLDATFMERAAFTDAFALSRQIGLAVGFGGDDYTLNVGVYRGSNGTDAEDEGYTISGRATYGPKFGDLQLHLGASFRYQNVGDDQSLLRYRQRPFSHLAKNRYIATSRIAKSDTLIGLEAAAIMGPLAVQSEYAKLNANLASGGDDPSFSGGYIEASYILTGESLAYDPKKGYFGRIKVNNPVFEGGMGAFQLAARFDTIDLSDDGIFGGEQDTITLGANWWLNRHTRLMFNYSYVDIENAFDVDLNGSDGENSVDTFSLRAQINW